MTTSKIKILSSKTINLIAAGEVVERPASVVKELLENAIDSGATEIEVTISTAGKNLIAIKDNGCGMTKEEMQIAVERYATSKLDEEDIFKISTFRGEALPSIAAISRITMYSRPSSQEFGNKMIMEGGEILSIHTSPCRVGTAIEVRDLFYAVPARLKFLKNDRSETSYIIDIFNKIALAHPNITFKLMNDIKILLRYERTDSTDERIRQVLGDEFFNHSIQVAHNHGEMQISGIVSQPTYNKRTSTEQHFYINKRPVKDKFLQIAMKLAYQDVMASDRFPAGVVYIALPYHEIDVNVHPAKTEIRFRDSDNVRHVLSKAIKEKLQQNSLHSIETTSKSFFDYVLKTKIDNVESQENNEVSSAYKNLYEPNFNFIKPNPVLFEPVKSVETHRPAQSVVIERPVSFQKTFDMPVHYPLGHAKCQIFGTYMISEAEDKIFVVDIHAAHERVIYEKFKKEVAVGVKRQKLLLPEEILLDENKIANILENKQIFEKFGFMLSKSHNFLLIHEVPAAFKVKDLAKLFEDVADDIASYNFTSRIDEIFEQFYETLACHTSIRAGDSLSIPEMNQLLRDMEQTLLIDQCNHGRPTYNTISKKDFEKLFNRT